jgi:hypothetical protein
MIKTVIIKQAKTLGQIVTIVTICLIIGCTVHDSEKNIGFLRSRRIEFSREFAPSDGMIIGAETSARKEICLNGKWDFRDPYYKYYSKSDLVNGEHQIIVEVIRGAASPGPYEQ